MPKPQHPKPQQPSTLQAEPQQPRQKCPNCLRPQRVCYCHTITRINNRWPVTILQHPSETQHAIGTARIAYLSLQHCQLLNSNQTEDQSLLTQTLKQKPILIYPGEDSTPLEEATLSPSTPLLFIDASWRKSRRLLFENPALAALPKIQLKPIAQSRYQIRKQPNADAISTLEAIVQTLSALELNEEKYQPMLATMDWMIDQQIKAMGEDVFKQHYGNKNRDM